MINNENGDSLIGVYKRCLRIGLEMRRRGHEVFMFCTGREGYHDDTVERAGAAMQFVDIPFKVLFCPSVEVRRRYYRKVFSRVAPELVVVGEVPLAGTLLDSTLCAAGLEVPVVVLDNAYNPELADAFHESHGPMLEGMILTGPSSFQMPNPPAYYCAASPFISGSGHDADALLCRLGFASQKLVTVLGYERKAETLAAALLEARQAVDWQAVFLSPDPEESAHRFAYLPRTILERIRFIRPPEEAVLFSLLKRSTVIVGKCGFMQVSESLALGTPFIGIHYRGCFSVEMLHGAARNFVYSTRSVEAEAGTLEAFDRFLHLAPEEIRHLHRGGFDGLNQAAEFLESLPQRPRRDTTAETEKLGYTRAAIEQSLTGLHPGIPIRVLWSRATRLRNYPECLIDCVTAAYTASGRRRQAYLWGRRYSESRFADQDRALAEEPLSARQLLFQSENGLLVLEKDAGESYLPPLNI